MEQETFICDQCGEVHPLFERNEFDDQHYCGNCFDEFTRVCSHCGVRIFADANAGNEDTPLCDHCYGNHYTTCERCGALLRSDEAWYEDSDDSDPYCYACYQDINSRYGIHDYAYKPEPIFFGSGPRYFGVELEIDGAGEISSYANDIEDVANYNGREHLYIKHDGSLDDGFELVTHPMSLHYHLNEMPWKDVLQEAISLHYLSHSAGTCGLHIHVSRNAFGYSSEEQDSCIARILWFFEKHWNELLRFSRRTQRQLDRWARRYGYKDHPGEMLEHVKKGYGDRYTCVNLVNTYTIEFRMFRGTLKYNTLIATLQLVNRICDVAISYSDEDLRNLSWSEFVSEVTEPELIRYLKERRLYINESVTMEAEI